MGPGVNGATARSRAHRRRERWCGGAWRAALLTLCVALAPALVMPGAAAAAAGASTPAPLGGGITSPGATPTTTSTPTVADTTTGSGGGGVSSGTAIGIAVAAFVIIIGIAGAILRDARRRTRDRHTPSVDAERVPGSRRPPKSRKLSSAERKRRKRGRAPRRR